MDISKNFSPFPWTSDTNYASLAFIILYQTQWSIQWNLSGNANGMYIKNRYEFNSKILPKFGLGTHAKIKIKNFGNSYEILYSSTSCSLCWRTKRRVRNRSVNYWPKWMVGNICFSMTLFLPTGIIAKRLTRWRCVNWCPLSCRQNTTLDLCTFIGN